MNGEKREYSLRDPEEIKRRTTGDIAKLNARLLRLSRQLEREARDRRAIRTVPGMVLFSLFRKAVNTFEAIEALKRKRLIEEAWILLRVLLESHVNLIFFVRNDPRKMVIQYLDASLLEKLKHLREVNFYQGTSYESKFTRAEWEKKEQEIKSRYPAPEFSALKKNGFSGLSFEQRARAVGYEKMYTFCYRIACRSVHAFDPAETPVFGKAFRGRRKEIYGLLRARREQLEANQNVLLGRLAYLMSEFTRSHRILEVVLIGLGYEKFLDGAKTLERPVQARERRSWSDVYLWPL